jgi:hypothetical protein
MRNRSENRRLWRRLVGEVIMVWGFLTAGTGQKRVTTLVELAVDDNGTSIPNIH